jgi:hypothetical protein
LEGEGEGGGVTMAACFKYYIIILGGYRCQQGKFNLFFIEIIGLVVGVKRKGKPGRKEKGGLGRISKEKERAEKGEGWINEVKVLERRGG